MGKRKSKNLKLKLIIFSILLCIGCIFCFYQNYHIILTRYANYAEAGVDIVFSGHVHGGQVIIPGKGGLISPDMEFFPELYKGEYHFGDMTMYLSAGLGNSILPLRINNYPEIVVLDIVDK